MPEEHGPNGFAWSRDTRKLQRGVVVVVVVVVVVLFRHAAAVLQSFSN